MSFTIVFEGELREYPGNPFKMQTPFGIPQTVAKGDVFEERDRLEDERDELAEALHKIKQWSEAYPLTVFPEPDLKKAHDLLQAGGMTLDAISASCMRHVVEGVGKIAREALATSPSKETEG